MNNNNQAVSGADTLKPVTDPKTLPGTIVKPVEPTPAPVTPPTNPTTK